MSISTLLRHVGLHAPRGVSVDGRVLTGDALAAGLAAGTATRLTPHTFHGGEDPADDDNVEPWWIDEVARERDVAAVRRAFPGFRLDDANGGYAWTGMIDTGRGHFEVSLDGNPNHRLPRIRPIHPSRVGRNHGRRGFRRPDHTFLSGNLCVAEEADFDPARDTTATVIGWVAHWCAAYVDWYVGGHWNVEGYRPHATA